MLLIFSFDEVIKLLIIKLLKMILINEKIYYSGSHNIEI
jgi:hypothetical protein